MSIIRAKKHLGQHFLTDLQIAQRIADSINIPTVQNVLEIGPGMGVLTQFLIKNPNYNLRLIELDTESVAYLNDHFKQLEGKVIYGDFLRYNLSDLFGEPFIIIGNFPYNISSQILFKMLEHRETVPQLVGMFQKEVAERVAAPPGNKTYGILSVLLQAFYHIEYLFTVHEHVFSPPPKVKSGVIRLTRNQTGNLACDETLFFRVVKTGFNQRRKTLSNSLKPIIGNAKHTDPIFLKRPEQLGVEEFVRLTNLVSNLIAE